MKPKNPYTPFSKFCFRTPTLPYTVYEHITSETEIPSDAYTTLWDTPIIKEALFMASPELYREIQKWQRGEISDPKTIAGLQSSFLKYIARITTRCTPFGLFAGCSIGVLAKVTDIQLDSVQQHTRQTRFDMNFLVACSQELPKQEHIKKQLHWYPNNSLYKIGNQYRYVEYTYNAQNRREHSLEAVTHTPYLQEIVEKSTAGATIDTLIAILLQDEEIALEEATSYINALIDNQILVSQLEPSVSGEDFLKQIREILLTYTDTEELCQRIAGYQQQLTAIDQRIGNPVSAYLELSELVKEMNVPIDQKYLLQTDLYPKTVHNQLDIKWGYKIKRLMPLFNKMTTAPKETNLSRFRDAFSKRYETREIELTTALDTEIGIGYLQGQDASDATPFLEGLDIPFRKGRAQSFSWTPIHEMLSKKLQHNEDYILEIADADVDSYEENWDDLPDTMSTMAELVKCEGVEKMVLSSIGGSSAANLLGRFTNGDPEMLTLVKEITDKEKELNPNQILAEIIHLPESRIGNVIQRETLRAYEIPYLGKSNLPEDQQLPVTDLMISIKGGHIVLRSKKLNRYVLPRLSNAHNYSANALPIYQFLCDLQTQNKRSGIGFFWGSILEKKQFLPRVVYGDFIISKARWTIENRMITKLLESPENEFITAITNWRKPLRIPKLVQLVDGDNTLLINLENRNSTQMWLTSVKKRASCTLEEFLFTEDCVVKREQEGFTNECIISFYKGSSE